MEIRTVGVLGAGQMGGGIAQVAATAGYEVVLADASLALAPGGEVRAETVSGDIRLVLPRNLSARVEASSFSGGLSAPGAKARKEGFGTGSSLNHRYGNGDGEIHIETFSGDAEVVLE